MKQYGLSKSKLLKILYKPQRKEKGIVPGTTAVMRTNPTSLKLRGAGIKSLKWRPVAPPGEIWLMFKDVSIKADGPTRRMISAWRYPGITKPGDAIPIPDEILQELLNEEKNGNK